MLAIALCGTIAVRRRCASVRSIRHMMSRCTMHRVAGLAGGRSFHRMLIAGIPQSR